MDLLPFSLLAVARRNSSRPDFIPDYLTLFKPPSHEELFTRYYQPYPNVVAALERGETATDAKTRALQLYEYQQYAAALPRLQTLRKESPQAADLLFYTALTHAGLQQNEEAITLLKKVTAQADSPFTRQAHWYLALLLLKTDREEVARQHLHFLLNGNDLYARQSIQLLKEL